MKCKHHLVAILASLAVSSVLATVNQDVVPKVRTATSRLFKPEAMGGVTFYKATNIGPPVCPSNTTVIASFEPHKTVQKTFVVHHANITVDGSRCGTNNTENETIWIVPSIYLQDNKSAELSGVTEVFNLLSANTRARGSFQNLIAVDPVFVGVEMTSDRICGGRVVWQKNSIYIFIQAEGKILDFGVYGWINEKENAMLSYAPPVGTSVSTLCVFKDSTSQRPNMSAIASPSPSSSAVPPATSSSASPSPSSSSDKNSSKDGDSCFPGTAVLELESGRFIQARNLKFGDRVRVGPAEFSAVIMFTHKNPQAVSRFVQLTTESGHSISLTPGHYIYANGNLKLADEVGSGDNLILSDGTSTPVHSVEHVMMQGLYNPQTIDGRIVVNGILASTYTSAVPPFVAHALLAPIRFLFRFGMDTNVRLFYHSNFGAAKLLRLGTSMY